MSNIDQNPSKDSKSKGSTTCWSRTVILPESERPPNRRRQRDRLPSFFLRSSFLQLSPAPPRILPLISQHILSPPTSPNGCSTTRRLERGGVNASLHSIYCDLVAFSSARPSCRDTCSLPRPIPFHAPGTLLIHPPLSGETLPPCQPIHPPLSSAPAWAAALCLHMRSSRGLTPTLAPTRTSCRNLTPPGPLPCTISLTELMSWAVVTATTSETLPLERI